MTLQYPEGNDDFGYGIELHAPGMIFELGAYAKNDGFFAITDVDSNTKLVAGFDGHQMKVIYDAIGKMLKLWNDQ